MLDKLLQIEKEVLPELLNNESLWKSMYIDYHPPVVARLWTQYENVRIYLHKIYPCQSSIEALFHPHPWESAIRILNGKYEMGVGHSATDEIPKIDCRLILPVHSTYEMKEMDGWHYVNPIKNPVYSLMVTGNRFSRKMPVEPDKNFRELTEQEKTEIFDEVKFYYRNYHRYKA